MLATRPVSVGLREAEPVPMSEIEKTLEWIYPGVGWVALLSLGEIFK